MVADHAAFKDVTTFLIASNKRRLQQVGKGVRGRVRGGEILNLSHAFGSSL